MAVFPQFAQGLFSGSGAILILIVPALLFMFLGLAVFASRYRRCPPNRLLVIYGHTKSGSSQIIGPGGAALVWPIIQDFAYLSLEPITVPNCSWGDGTTTTCTVQISTQTPLKEHAAERLLGLRTPEIKDLVREAAMDVAARPTAPPARDQAMAEKLHSLGLELVAVRPEENRE